jgi:hypothetical protein
MAKTSRATPRPAAKPRIFTATLRTDGTVLKQIEISEAEEEMKYFRPELFVAFNSEDTRTANRASRAWEQAVRAYDEHLKSIRRRLPPAVRKLSRFHLHDAEYRGFQADSDSPDNGFAQLIVKQPEQWVSFSYFLLEEPLITQPVNDRLFSDHGVHWLYDELELVGPRDVSHEILFSNGRVFRFRFRHVTILTITTEAEVNRSRP